MNDDEIKHFLKNVTWDMVKNLPHDYNRICLVNNPNEEYEAYLYFVIFDSKRKMHKYLGYNKNLHFMVSYTGTPITYKEQFNEDLSKCDYRIICLAVGSKRQMKVKEGIMLDFLDAKKNEEYFNNSNETFLKGFKPHQAVKRVKKNYENYEDVFLPKKEWQDMGRWQVRDVSEIDGHVTTINHKITDTRGKWLEEHHKGVMALKNYHGKGKHLRIGSYHTIEASMNSDYVTELKGKLIPEEDWEGIDPLGIETLGHWDNRQGADVYKPITDPEALDTAKRMMEKYDIKHNDDIIKDYLLGCGIGPSKMQKYFWPKLRVWNADKKTDIPLGHQIIDYHKTTAGRQRAKEIEESWTDETTHCKVLGTSYFSTVNWEGWTSIIEDLNTEEFIQKPNWKILFFHKNGVTKNKWPKRQVEVEKQLNDLVKKFDKKKYSIKFDFEVLPYSAPKKIKKNDK